MIYLTFVLLLCAAMIRGLKFRFDYTFSEEANGWLKLHRMPDRWNAAKERCQNEGAILASPLTDELRESILKYVSNEVDTIFTGVHATFSQGDYSSIEGTPLSWMPITWAPGEPNNEGNLERCLEMKTRDGTMGDAKCDDPLPYVCFKKWSNLTQTECGTHDIEYKLDKRTGSCYKFHTRGLNWSKAYVACAAEGAYLAIINSLTEASILKELFAKYHDRISTKYKINVIVGLRDLRDGASWMTIHGQTVTEAGYEQWDHNQPDNYTQLDPSGEACGAIRLTGNYNDVSCSQLVMAFICEKTPNSLLNININFN